MPDAAAVDGQNLRQVATRGAALLILQAFTSRLVLFGVQFVLAWLLTPEDFGQIALAGVVSAVAWTFVGFGIDEALQQRGRSIRYWEKTVFVVSIAIAAVAAIAVALVASATGSLFDAPDIGGMLLLSALSLLIASFSVVSAAKVTANLEFRWLAGYNVFELLASHGMIVLFAWLGFGAYSYALGSPLMAALRVFLFWRRAPPRLVGRIRVTQVKAMLSRGGQVFGTRVVQTALQQGDYFVLGLFATTHVVGAYTFAFRLAGVPVRIIATALQNVLLPALTRFNSNQAQQEATALKSAEVLSHVVAPMCLLQAGIAGPALTLLFHDKWDASVPLIQWLSIGLPMEAVYAVARARMSAGGQFKRALWLMCAQTALFLIAVSIGAVIASDVGVALAVSAFYVFVTPPFFFQVFSDGGHFWLQTWRILIRPLVLSALSLGAALLVSRACHVSHLGQIALITVVGTSAYLLLMRLFCAELFHAILRLTNDLRARAAS